MTISDIKGCIIIPTYNNEKTLRRVVLEVMTIVPKESIIIVNDGSTDSTSEILNEFENHVLILKNEQNKGKGFSLRKGFKKAIELGFYSEQGLVSVTNNDNFPPKPNFLPITGNATREKLFGKFAYKPTPSKQNPEGIVITDDWAKKNIIKVNLPALALATNGTYKSMMWHKECEYQLVKLFERLHWSYKRL